MWFIPTKKELKHELDKVRASFRQIKLEFEERDAIIKQLRAKTEANTLKIAVLQGSYLALAKKSQSQVLSKSQAVSRSLKQVSAKSQSKFETKLLKKIKRSKKAFVIAEIIKLLGSHSTIDIFNKLVTEQGLCSKASFYRYITNLKSQKLYETETKTEAEAETEAI